MISIAHVIAGEERNENAFLHVWGGAKEEGRVVFSAARSLITDVPITKVLQVQRTDCMMLTSHLRHYYIMIMMFIAYDIFRINEHNNLCPCNAGIRIVREA